MGFKKIISSLLAVSLLASFCTTAGINSPVYDVGASSGNLLSANSGGANQSEISAQVRSLQHDISSENLLYEDMSDTNFSEDSMHAERFPIGEYREMAEIVEHKLIFSVVEHCKKGSDITYIDENSELCMKYSLTNVSVVYEKLKETDDYEDVYCVFYETYTAADDVWTIIDSMAEDEKIFSAEPDYIYTSADIGEFEHMQNLLDTETEDGTEGVTEENNPLETEYSYNCTHLESVNAKSAWMSLINNGIDPGTDTVVAVIDSGVDYTHEDLSRNIWINTGEIPGNGIDDDGNGYIDDCIGVDFAENDMDPMDDNGHGTHVAGTIAMQDNNGGGIGVAFDSKIMCIKAAGRTGKLINSDVIKAIKYAADNGADVINMSFGSSDKSYMLETVLEDAYSKCILVASAGNDGKSTAFYPGGYDYVIGVMATDDRGKLTDFSNWDANPNSDFEYDIAAPGYKVYSTIPGNKYARLSGTSKITFLTV